MVEDKEQADKAASDRKVADNKKKKKKADEDKDADLSDEDLEIKNNLLLIVTRLGEGDAGVQKLALQQVANEIRSATTSMTSVPKPLKFLRAHYQTLVDIYGRTSDAEVKQQLADVLSVLAITTGKEGERACLKYRLLGSKVRRTKSFLDVESQMSDGFYAGPVP
jgi:26S proteasome regulatory subunit N1